MRSWPSAQIILVPIGDSFLAGLVLLVGDMVALEHVLRRLRADSIHVSRDDVFPVAPAQEVDDLLVGRRAS